jgi:endonuclease/exonuclease/phosphatase family metal-dependent hydrolase
MFTHVSPALLAAPILGAALLFAGCSAVRTAPSADDAQAYPMPAENEFSVMSFNLHRYALEDRDEGADPLAPKAPARADALADVVVRAAPHVLVVQEMGDPAAWEHFKSLLSSRGLDYRYEDYLRRDPDDRNLAVLSRYPIVGRFPRTNDLYTIGPRQFPVRRGFLEVEIEVNPAYRFRILAAHLVSKTFHEFGQAEMRRSEARILGNHVRAALAENTAANLLVVGDFNDLPGSRPLREIAFHKDAPLLFDLRPADADGNAWTRILEDDVYQRSDYLLASASMLNEAILPKTYAVRSPDLLRATDHAPLVATFEATERGPESAPDLSDRRPHAFPQGH